MRQKKKEKAKTVGTEHIQSQSIWLQPRRIWHRRLWGFCTFFRHLCTWGRLCSRTWCDRGLSACIPVFVCVCVCVSECERAYESTIGKKNFTRDEGLRWTKFNNESCLITREKWWQWVHEQENEKQQYAERKRTKEPQEREESQPGGQVSYLHTVLKRQERSSERKKTCQRQTS